MAINILTNGQTVTLSSNSDEFFATGEGRIRVFNTGTGQATGVEVIVSLSAGITINGDTPTAGTFAVDTWSLATLDPCSTPDCNGEEEFLDLSFLVTDDSLQPYTITYTVTHDDSPDDVLADNAGSRTIGGISCSSFTDCVEDSAEFTTVSDTDSIDLTLTGVNIEADIILDPAVSNLLSVSAAGVLADLNIGAGLTGNGASTPLAVSVVDTNFFADDLDQTGNRVHDQAGFDTVISNVNEFTLESTAGVTPFTIQHTTATIIPAQSIVGSALGLLINVSGSSGSGYGLTVNSNILNSSSAGIRINNTGTGTGIDVTNTNALSPGVPGVFTVVATSGTTVRTILTLENEPTAVGGVGTGGQIRFNLKNDASTTIESSHFRTILTAVGAGVETSQFEFRLRSLGAALARRAAITGAGQLILDEYGAGTFAGTETFLLAADVSGNVIEVDPLTFGIPINNLLLADGTNTINNANFAQEWQWNTLGGSTGLRISSTSTAAGSDNQRLVEINLSGANAGASQTTYALSVSNLHTGTTPFNYGGYFTTQSLGAAVVGQNLTTGYGVQALSVTGTALIGATSNAAGLAFNALGSRTLGAVTEVARFQSDGTGGTNGTGTSVTFYAPTSTSNQVMSVIDALWTDATNATRTGRLNFYTTNSAVSARKLSIAGNGQLTADEYGTGTFTGTETFSLAVDASGNVIERQVTQTFTITEYDTNADVNTLAVGLKSIVIPASVNGYDLISATAGIYTLGASTGAETLAVNVLRRRAGANVSMLSTPITLIDTEYFQNDGVIDAANDDVATGDVLVLSILNSFDTTDAQGLTVTLVFGL